MTITSVPPSSGDGGIAMRGRLLRATAGLLALAAAPLPLPVPPVPPAKPPTDTAAPVPDIAQRAPLAIANEDTQVRLRLYRARRYDGSRGFLPGSRYESSEDRKPIQTPGFSVTVPLH